MTQTVTEHTDSQLELIAEAEGKFVELLQQRTNYGDNIVPIRETRRPIVIYLKQTMGKVAKQVGKSVYPSREELRMAVEEATQKLGYKRYKIGLRVDAFGVPKRPFTATRVEEPDMFHGQEYWVKQLYVESFSAKK